MSLTTSAYYVNDVNIPDGTYSGLAASITRYEPEILRQLLGYDLAKLVLAYNVNTSSQIIKDIVEGKDYTEGSNTIHWNGLLNTEKVSILSYYVYINHIRDNAVTFQAVGAVGSKAEGGVTVTTGVLMQKAGYRLRELAGYQGQDPYAPSLYNFMAKHESSYPTWLWNEFKPFNTFGI
jgi:hypothetical protein